MGSKVVKQTGPLKYVMTDCNYAVNNHLGYFKLKLEVINQNNRAIYACYLNINVGGHSKDKPAVYHINEKFFKPNPIIDYADVVKNVFKITEEFIDEREFRYVQIKGHYLNSNRVIKSMQEEGYKIDGNGLVKNIYVPYVRTHEQLAKTYTIESENADKTMEI